MNTTNYTITALTATNNIATAMFANGKHLDKFARNNKVALLETFKTILNRVKPSTELMEKPVLVITTQSILKGFTTGTYIEYIRTGEDASGNKFAEDELALIHECAQLLAERALNIRLIDEKFVSTKDKEAQTIKKQAFDVVKQLAKTQALKQTKEKVAQQPAPEVNDTIVLLNAELKKAILAGNIELASQYTNMIAQLTAPKATPVAEETNEVEVPEEQEVTDETLANDAEEIDM
jgi:hypothetical protein